MTSTTGETKQSLHPRNKFNKSYNFKQLINSTPELKSFVIRNPNGISTIDFANPEAVKTLNKALLKANYNLHFWDIPKNSLCPPIPSRADYIHYIADLLAEENNGTIPTGNEVIVLDIGIGANCIYPILGHYEYQWKFVGSDIDNQSIANAKKIISNNHSLRNKIEVRLQTNKKQILKGIIKENEKFDVVISNPPFFSSKNEALTNSTKKLKNLGINHSKDKIVQNFGGQSNELWCDGGEKAFITSMIYESRDFKNQCKWFTSLVSKKDNLKPLQETLKRINASDFRIIQMQQGNKISRILAWKF